ncbi:MAG: ornithine carbamoyltransferase [Candidatus Mcinerneyibacterium aminivorans]|uniref:Ornithine carbamoyltransferase n=1 Tax=Candidatus Mcinerneyibacterium aminivorans TaxID=2703815 RepID=A0A5D0MH94_9BACT|nr:MAG: ornithine carbamoyltransferase [Candidatus Mcinerneyibacterium aminivorans]
MAFNLRGRSLLTLKDYTKEEINFLIDLSETLKKNKNAGIFPKNLENKNIALIFEKPSTRTRAAFTVACTDEGAHPEYLGKNDIQLGGKETIKDTARVLGRMFDGIEFRGFKHETVEKLAKWAGVPVWNGLTDQYHPTQILADFLTVKENFGKLKDIKFAYVGDGRNNMANSLMLGASKVGMDFKIVAPKKLHPDKNLVEEAKEFAKETGATITITDDVDNGTKGVQVIYTDVWASMGEEDVIPQRIELLEDYRVNMEMINNADDEVIFLHCLPSYHDDDTDMASKYPGIKEVTDEVFESKHSKVFDQAENRLHTIKAVMVATAGKQF